MTDKVTGAAEIRVKEGETLNFEEQHFYKFSIVAEDCGSPPKQSTKFVYFLMAVLKHGHTFPTEFYCLIFPSIGPML